MELTPQQISVLERLHVNGFEIVAFPMYASHVGVRNVNCAALLNAVASGGFTVFGSASYLIGGNLTVRVTHQDKDWFVWKQERLEVTPARLAELEKFTAELSTMLLPTA
ncbi:MAG: hypothetical protein ACRD5M_16970 [Candidatus Acidiferrales bacterium]